MMLEVYNGVYRVVFGRRTEGPRFMSVYIECGLVVAIDHDHVQVTNDWEAKLASGRAVRLINARREMLGFCMQQGLSIPRLSVEDAAALARALNLPGLSACINYAFRYDEERDVDSDTGEIEKGD
jgi:hypothetical protein